MNTIIIVGIVLLVILFVYKKVLPMMLGGAGLDRSVYDDEYLAAPLPDTPEIQRLKEHALGTESAKS